MQSVEHQSTGIHAPRCRNGCKCWMLHRFAGILCLDQVKSELQVLADLMKIDSIAHAMHLIVDSDESCDQRMVQAPADADAVPIRSQVSGSPAKLFQTSGTD